MSSRFPKIEKLEPRLRPYGFDHCYDFGVFEIGFSRPSVVPNLFEHLHVCGQGKHAEVLYPMTALSAIKYFDPDECVSIRDLDLMFLLERNTDRHWTEIRTPGDKKDWENRLIEAADDACRKTSQKLGAELLNLIAQERPVADRFIALAGDLSTVLDREFAYLNETPHEQLQKITDWSWAHKDDNRLLAAHLFFRLAKDIDSRLLQSCDCRLRDNDPLRRLLLMITDHVATCRTRFLTSK
jgi:hypothetical protein